MMIRKLLVRIWAIFTGLFTVFKHSFKRRVTLEYPEKKAELSNRFRGKHVWNSSKCVACKVCEKVCPADAIKIEKADDNIKFAVDYSKCIFCGNCEYYCKNSAIKLSKTYEMATDTKADLMYEMNSSISDKKLDFNEDKNL